MPSVIRWQPLESAQQVIRHLTQGECVALPTESTYEIVGSGLIPEAVAGLANLDAAPAVVVNDYVELFDWLPLLGGEGARLLRKLRGGPIVLSADAGFQFGLWSRLPEMVRAALVQDGRISLRWPRHPIWNELRIADLPLLSVPLDSAKIAEDAASCAVDVACVVDAGPAEFGGPPSMVQSDGRRCTLVREGGLARQLFEELTLCRILFVCTGNTCRSPLAQALCARLLADRLGVAPGELRQHGFVVQSAGLAAMMGNDASPESVTVAAEFGADLSGHKSTMATLEMLQMADHVFAMTASHWYTLMGVGPAGCVQPRMLSPTFDDIADPIGGALVDYRTCAHQIMECLQLRLPQLLES